MSSRLLKRAAGEEGEIQFIMKGRDVAKGQGAILHLFKKEMAEDGKIILSKKEDGNKGKIRVLKKANNEDGKWNYLI